MKKVLMTALVAVLTTSTATIPAVAATPAEGQESGGFIGTPAELARLIDMGVIE